MKFSDRIGATKPVETLSTDQVPATLKTRIWNLSNVFLYPAGDGFREEFLDATWINFYVMESDLYFTRNFERYDRIKKMFFEMKWYEYYNYLEFFVEHFSDALSYANNILSEEKSAFRFIGEELAPITSDQEISEIQNAANTPDQYAGARTHIQSAVSEFAKKPTPQYAAVVRESISAVESVVKVISGDKNATLAQALEQIDRPLHPAFAKGLKNLYGYTSDEKGIRHALLEEKAKVDEADAHFMLVICSAFVNFLIQAHEQNT